MAADRRRVSPFHDPKGSKETSGNKLVRRLLWQATSHYYSNQAKKANHSQPPLVRPRHQLTTNRHLDCNELIGGTDNAETHTTYLRQRYFTLLPALSHNAKVSPPSSKAERADNIHKTTSEWAQQCSTTHWMIRRPHYYSYRSNRGNMDMTATLNTSGKHKILSKYKRLPT
ncbi:Hypothetical predicted protein [Pelobates cultripes]|uniref:Uncharacterized protein n=1 Tax=Pelobates cultripes TaxID=61616 RepID=A0AAD1T0I4_PELCU|nr:Hypothetical predicted protein [Pelobates cultripes]